MHKKTVLFLLALCFFNAEAAKPWRAQVSQVSKDFEKWKLLTEQLMAQRLYYGAMASAQRILIFHTDLPAKEYAYSKIIELVGMGYPLSTKRTFVSADIEPPKSSPFADSYYFYKAVTAQEMGMKKW